MASKATTKNAATVLFILIIYCYEWLVKECYLREREESNADKGKRSIEFRWWQALLCARELSPSESLFVSLLLALIAHSFGSVLFSAVWSLAACEPHLKHYASALCFWLLLRWCHSPFHGLSNCNGVTRTGWPFQKAFQWKCFFNGVPAGTLLIMCMNCSILSLPTKATPNVIGQNATSIFFNCK